MNYRNDVINELTREFKKIAADYNLTVDCGVIYSTSHYSVQFIDELNGKSTEVYELNIDLMNSIENAVRIIKEKALAYLQLETVTEEVNIDRQKSSYRDKLVERIKQVGQDLVDRAETFIAKDMDRIGDFAITVNFPQDGPITIQSKTETYCKHEIRDTMDAN